MFEHMFETDLKDMMHTVSTCGNHNREEFSYLDND